MVFFYERYFLECFEMAIFILIFMIFFLCSIICTGIKFIKNKELTRKKATTCISLFLLCIFFVFMVGGHLRHGGVYLICEKEQDVVKSKGYISEINGLGIFSLPRIECEYYSDLEFGDPTGYEFKINDIYCTAPVKGDLKVGDFVEVEYLPKSGYILYINRVESEIEVITEKEYYTLEDFQSIVVGESTFSDVYEIAPMDVVGVTAAGLTCKYSMENGQYICIEFCGKESIVSSIEVD